MRKAANLTALLQRVGHFFSLTKSSLRQQQVNKIYCQCFDGDQMVLAVCKQQGIFQAILIFGYIYTPLLHLVPLVHVIDVVFIVLSSSVYVRTQ